MESMTRETDAYLFIKKAILDRRFSNGDVVNQEDLAKELSMSRTPIRGALSRLAGEGLIRLQQHHGAIVWTESLKGKEPQ